MGILGVVLVTAGHWLSDFGYYVFVSFIMHRHASYVNPRQHQISTILELFLTALGVYFVQQGLEKIVLYFSLSFSLEKISAEIRRVVRSKGLWFHAKIGYQETTRIEKPLQVESWGFQNSI